MSEAYEKIRAEEMACREKAISLLVAHGIDPEEAMSQISDLEMHGFPEIIDTIIQALSFQPLK